MGFLRGVLYRVMKGKNGSLNSSSFEEFGNSNRVVQGFKVYTSGFEA